MAFAVSMLLAKVEMSPVEQNTTTLTALVLKSEMALLSVEVIPIVLDVWAKIWLFLYCLILICPLM